jgi:hypothetical protein
MIVDVSQPSRQLLFDKHPHTPSAWMMLLILSDSPWQDSCLSGGRIKFYRLAG